MADRFTMGRPFATELASLAENIRFALEHSVKELREGIDRSQSGRILVCGAGGSFSAAVFAELLFEVGGVDAQAITPLEFLQSERPGSPTTLMLFTAGGRNKDVLRVIQHARNTGVVLLLICASTGSPAATLARRDPRNVVFEFSYPARKDGFLAVNSLAVTWWLLARAFGHATPLDTVLDRVSNGAEFDFDFVATDRRHVTLLLHDRWTRPVAVDLESKMSEAALCAPLISDWRQFGHGRHHWLAKNGAFSSVLAITLPGSDKLATRSLRALPKSVPQTLLNAEKPGVSGVCELLLRSFFAVGALGRRVGIDPGRPGVPAFGSALYRLSAPLPGPLRPDKLWDLQSAVERKIDATGARGDNSPVPRIVMTSAKRFLGRLAEQKFGAVVLDFDGTAAQSGLTPDMPLPVEIANVVTRLLRKRIIVGIATGRGDSCHINLTKALPDNLWSRVFVCHYNGASIGSLQQFSDKKMTWPNDPLLVAIDAELRAHPLIAAIAEIRFKGPQITLRASSRPDTPVVERVVRTFLAHRYPGTARLVASSHTMDIVPALTSKVALIEHIRNHHTNGLAVLAIGDRGDLPGNDFELLATPFSLSVDRVSTDLDSCWNFLPRGVSHQHGTALYLEAFRLREGHFQLNPQ